MQEVQSHPPTHTHTGSFKARDGWGSLRQYQHVLYPHTHTLATHVGNVAATMQVMISTHTHTARAVEL